MGVPALNEHGGNVTRNLSAWLAMVLATYTPAHAQQAELQALEAGRFNTFSSKGHPNAAGLDASFRVPRGWAPTEDASPDVVVNFQSASADAYCTFGVVNVGQPFDRAEAELSFTATGLRHFVPPRANILDVQSMTLNGRPAGKIWFTADQSVGGETQHLTLAKFVTASSPWVAALTCGAGYVGKSERPSKDFAAYLPLFDKIAESLVVHNQWEGIKAALVLSAAPPSLGGKAPTCANPKIKGSVRKGLEAYSAGDFDTALCHWLPKARQGDPAAQNNMGLLFESGLTASTPKSDNEAANWFALAARQGLVVAMPNLARVQLRLGYRNEAMTWLNLGARWGDTSSTAMLTQLGEVAPIPDLFMARQESQAQLGAALGQVIGCAVGGGCPANPVGVYTPTIPSAGVMQAQAPARSGSGSSASMATGAKMNMCPDGSYVFGDSCHLAPDGTFVGGRPVMAPDGSFVSGRPTLTPAGNFVGGTGKTTLCPDGSWVGGTRCKLMPNGMYIGEP
jgi:hypothetical protein